VLAAVAKLSFDFFAAVIRKKLGLMRTPEKNDGAGAYRAGQRVGPNRGQSAVSGAGHLASPRAGPLGSSLSQAWAAGFMEMLADHSVFEIGRIAARERSR
jgi:hypothetical protein